MWPLPLRAARDRSIDYGCSNLPKNKSEWCLYKGPSTVEQQRFCLSAATLIVANIRWEYSKSLRFDHSAAFDCGSLLTTPECNAPSFSFPSAHSWRQWPWMYGPRHEHLLLKVLLCIVLFSLVILILYFVHSFFDVVLWNKQTKKALCSCCFSSHFIMRLGGCRQWLMAKWSLSRLSKNKSVFVSNTVDAETANESL